MQNVPEAVTGFVSRQQALLDAIPHLVLLVKDFDCIAYMNQAAGLRFGDLRGEKAAEDLYKISTSAALLRLAGQAAGEGRFGTTRPATIHETHFEYTLAPFNGPGDSAGQLYWLFLRDVTARTRQQAEQAQAHRQLEAAHAQRAQQLQESEQARRNLEGEVDSLREELKNLPGDREMIGSSPALLTLRDLIPQVAASSAPVLICGESGTGKGLIADRIRAAGPRHDQPCIHVDCRNADHIRDTFPGADSAEPGNFAVVDHGTIFLDGIGALSPPLQIALLTILREQAITPLGGTTPTRLDVRVIAATSADLPALVQRGAFRLELYYRLAVNTVTIPPLRERPEDIVDLITYFVRKYRYRYQKEINFLPTNVVDRLLAHPWPGNVRELKGLIRRAVLLARGSTITGRDILFDRQPPAQEQPPDTRHAHNIYRRPLKDLLDDFEKNLTDFTQNT